ncbi:MAG: hypothetical protein EX263_09760, partial [Flavobacteriaceae bacterium]
MKVITLSQQDFVKKCQSLAATINNTPDVVVGIAQGGVHVMNAIREAKFFSGSSYYKAHLEVPARLKKQKSKLSPVLKRLPTYMANSLRKLEIKYSQRRLKHLDLAKLTNINVRLDLFEDQSNTPQHILIIDDAIDTGKTMFVVKNRIQQMFPNAQIEIAVLTWTINTAIVQPDYYLYKNVLIRFP